MEIKMNTDLLIDSSDNYSSMNHELDESSLLEGKFLNMKHHPCDTLEEKMNCNKSWTKLRDKINPDCALPAQCADSQTLQIVHSGPGIESPSLMKTPLNKQLQQRGQLQLSLAGFLHLNWQES